MKSTLMISRYYIPILKIIDNKIVIHWYINYRSTIITDGRITS